MKTKKKQKPGRTTRRTLTDQTKLPFIEHALELRRRMYYVAFSVFVVAAAAYGIQQHIVNILLRPARGEHFIYTTPGGGIDFLFRICLYTGLVVSLPVIVYNCLRFIEPVMNRVSWRFVVWGSTASGLLAITGVLFGYYLGLPAALHFLLHQFTTVQIKPLVTIQSYLSFVIVYMVGSSLIFQLPLMLIFINRIKPLKPKRLLHYERWVILIAFILSGLMNPTPNMISQLMIAGPFILVYQIGILLIAYLNRRRKVEFLHQNDLALQAARIARRSELKPLTVNAPLVGAPNRPQTHFIPIHNEAPSQINISQPVTAVRPLSRSELYANRRGNFMHPPTPRFSPSSLPSVDSMSETSI